MEDNEERENKNPLLPSKWTQNTLVKLLVTSCFSFLFIKPIPKQPETCTRTGSLVLHIDACGPKDQCTWTWWDSKRVSDKALFHLHCSWPAFLLPASMANRQWLPISLRRERGWSWRKELSTPIRPTAGRQLSKARSWLGRKHPKLESKNTEKQK